MLPRLNNLLTKIFLIIFIIGFNSFAYSEEKKAVLEVLEEGTLSAFAGTWSDGFYGGPEAWAHALW